MKKVILCSLVSLVILNGCILPTKRKLPIPKAPELVQSANAEQLVSILNERWKRFDTLVATVEMKPSVLKSNEGVAKDYPSFQAQILMRKPGKLRVLGKLPIVGTRMIDLASDGEHFTLYIPPYSKAVKGTNKMHKRSLKPEENLRPGLFFDSLIVRGLESTDLYTVTSDTVTTEDATRKHLFRTPEYILSIMRAKPGSLELEPVRVVYFHREDLLPYQQDLYDADGNLETQVYYSKYTKYGDNLYPGTVTIKRPIEEYEMVMTVQRVVENMPLTDDQFQITMKEDTKIQNLDDPQSADPIALKPAVSADPKP